MTKETRQPDPAEANFRDVFCHRCGEHIGNVDLRNNPSWRRVPKEVLSVVSGLVTGHTCNGDTP